MSDEDLDPIRAAVIKHVANTIINTLEDHAPDASNSELVNGTATALWWMVQALLNSAADEAQRETNRGELEQLLLNLWKKLHYHLPGPSIEVKH